MRNFIISFSVAIVLSSQLSSQTISASLSFEEKVFDFGKIQEKDGEVSHTFIFKNTGRTYVKIDEIVSDCGCTHFEFPEDPVAQGSKGKVTVSYNPAYRPGSFSKEIIVFSNNHKEISRIWIKGFVIPFIHPVEEDYPYDFGDGLHLSLKVLSFGKVAKGASKKIRLGYANDTDEPMTLHFVKDSNDRGLKFTDPGELLPRERSVMIFNYTMLKRHHGDKVFNIYPVINGRRLLVPLQVKVTGID